jgi:hypothetical protein
MTKQILAYFVSGLLGIMGITLAFGGAASAAAPYPFLPQEIFSPEPLPPAVPVSRLQTTPTLTPEVRSIPTVVILSPKTGEIFEQDQPIIVISKAVDPQGLARLYLMANGQVVGKLKNPDPESNQALLVSQFWFPHSVGDQAIRVIAYDTTGMVGKSEYVFVQVEALTTTTTPTPIPTSTPAVPYVMVTSAGAVRVRTGPSTQYEQAGNLAQGQTAVITGRNDVGQGTWWQIQFPAAPTGLGWISGNPAYVTAYNTENVPVVAPPPLPTPPPSPTPPPAPTPTPAPSIAFWADRTEIQPGECVIFSWKVSGVKAVYFEGEGVAGEGQSSPECPEEDRTYELQVEHLDGSVETRQIQIDIKQGGTGYNTSTIPREAQIDFDEDAQQSEQGNEFGWTFQGDEPIFGKVNDNETIRLISLEAGDTDTFNSLGKDTCRERLDREDRQKITISLDLMACFITDQNRVGKLRFTGGNQDELIMQWYVWD